LLQIYGALPLVLWVVLRFYKYHRGSAPQNRNILKVQRTVIFVENHIRNVSKGAAHRNIVFHDHHFIYHIAGLRPLWGLCGLRCYKYYGALPLVLWVVLRFYKYHRGSAPQDP